jgi:hypothetical protein
MAEHAPDQIQPGGPQPVLVEFATRPGFQQTALQPADLVEKSRRALDSAMNTVHEMADRLESTVSKMASKPSEIEVTFAIKLESELGALIAKTKVEGSIDVKLSWKSVKG